MRSVWISLSENFAPTAISTLHSIRFFFAYKSTRLTESSLCICLFLPAFYFTSPNLDQHFPDNITKEAGFTICCLIFYARFIVGLTGILISPNDARSTTQMTTCDCLGFGSTWPVALNPYHSHASSANSLWNGFYANIETKHYSPALFFLTKIYAPIALQVWYVWQ